MDLSKSCPIILIPANGGSGISISSANLQYASSFFSKWQKEDPGNCGWFPLDLSISD